MTVAILIPIFFVDVLISVDKYINQVFITLKIFGFLCYIFGGAELKKCKHEAFYNILQFYNSHFTIFEGNLLVN